MTNDLAETIAELGPGYDDLVGRLQAAYRPLPRVEPDAAPMSAAKGRVTGWSAAYLVAASLLVFLGLGLLFREPVLRGTSEAKLAYTVAYAQDAAARAAIVGSQRSDGGGSNDFQTRQNAAALRGASTPGERVAYKKAVRYLRTKGLLPLTDEELKGRGDRAARHLANT